jgi:hypothetical protein
MQPVTSQNAPVSLSVRDYLRHKTSAQNETPNPAAAGLGVADFVASRRQLLRAGTQ